MARGSFPILFITATRIGDAVLSSGLIKRLHDEIPQASFTIVAGPVAAPLFAEVPNLDEVIVFAKAKDGSHWFDLWRKVRKRRWGLIVDMRGSGISRFLSAKRRAVYRRPAGAAPVHKVLEAARVLRIEDDPAPPHIFTSPAIEAYADELTAGTGPILALAPAANWVGKTWPLERFSQVAIRLLRNSGAPLENGRLMVLGGRDEVNLGRDLKEVVARGQLIDLAGKVDLLTAYACLKRARLFIGNDSGAMHLAAAAGVPTLGLFGPSDERLYGPWGEHARAIRGTRTLEQIQQADPHLTQAICHMMDLGVEPVLRAAEQLLAESEPAPLARTQHG
ncbi:glycosyltransferase family 9 protein [Phenylobacterium soli]|uniref:Glycosyltransferase family 9 protein n=1 Tax=Phenylobacterium soli TaxID=2170551 RepID=A0A328AI56_9CAUL|nr:glycosyltransferase family 9 protein [Phenylobacterium soli]RAK54221.1 glycosyltransferase family 9 protein [Phenylobacterium soli]